MPPIGFPTAIAISALVTPARAVDHLLITEVAVTPNAGEFIEIANPMAVTYDLTNVWLADHATYWQIVTGGPMDPGDFRVRFPTGAIIPPHGVVTVAIQGGLGFAATYGIHPSFEIVANDPLAADMLGAPDGPSLTNAGEGIELFRWDGVSNLVQDIDIVRLGLPSASNDIPNKSGVIVNGSAYLTDHFTMPVMTAVAGVGFSYKRIQNGEGSELLNGGNGITGHDETTEPINLTWDGSGVAFTAPSPSVFEQFLPCPADVDHNFTVNVTDLLAVIGAWGACADPNNCPADTNNDDQVNVTDLLAVIGAWGACP